MTEGNDNVDGSSQQADESENPEGGAIHVPPGEGESIWIAGDTYNFKLTGKDTDGSYFMVEAPVPPGAGPPPHVHKNEDECFYVLEGEFEFQNGEETIHATEGSVVHIPQGTLHRFENVSETDAKMLSFVTPAGLEEFFFEVGVPAKEGETPPAPGPEEMERTIANAPTYGMELRLPDQQ